MCRYERDYVIPGEPYAGFDRHNGEIAGFHLDGYVYVCVYVRKGPINEEW